jgi:hypothetical protein
MKIRPTPATWLWASAGLALVSGTAFAQDFSRDPAYGTWNLVAASQPSEATVNLQSGGEIDASGLGTPCTGFIANAPDYRVNYTPGGHPLTFTVTSQFDTTLVINGPDGRWYCDDDGGEGNQPLIRFGAPSGGQYDVWVGTYGEARLRSAQLRVSEALTEEERRAARRRLEDDQRAARRAEENARRIEEERRAAAARAEQQRLEAAALEARRIAERAAAEAAREERRRDLISRFGAAHANAILAGDVAVGMSPDAVREALGAPRRIERVAPGEEMWVYDQLRVVLLNNRVTFVRR